jgi:hypothetical protein
MEATAEAGSKTNASETISFLPSECMFSSTHVGAECATGGSGGVYKSLRDLAIRSGWQPSSPDSLTINYHNRSP